MKYIMATSEWRPLVEEFCHEHNIKPPSAKSSVFVAYELTASEIVIKGVVGIKQSFYIEPMISEDPIAAVNLFNQALGACMATGVGELRAIVKDEKKLKTFQKVGFKPIETGVFILSKEV